jgi:hypothetical protein
MVESFYSLPFILTTGLDRALLANGVGTLLIGGMAGMVVAAGGGLGNPG